MCAAASARDEAGGTAFVGASVRYQANAVEGYDTPSAAVFYPLGQERDQITWATRARRRAVAVGLTHQLATAARENVDFFAVEGRATADDVGRLGALFESYPETKVKSRVTDTRGFDHDGEEITAGFGAPVLLVAGGGADVRELARAAAAVPKIECLAATSATAEEAAELKTILGSGSRSPATTASW